MKLGANEEPGAGTLALSFVAFVAVWSLYFAISESQSSIHNDMAEAYAWGREFQLGYNQHPPFWAWICGVWFAIFPRAGWSFAILSVLNASLGLWGSWRLIGRFAEGDKRVAATALLLLTPFYTFLSYKFNANSIFLSLWPWTIYFFLRAIDEGALRDAVAFGVFLGCALLSKYYAGVLGATCLIAAWRHPSRGRYFRSISPYLSAAVAAAILAPHLYWLVTSGAPPLRYLGRVSGRGFDQTVFFATAAVIGALTQNLAMIGLVAFVALRKPCEAAGERHPRFGMLATLTLAPLALTLLSALVLRTKVSTNMMIGVFSLAPLFAIEVAGARGLARLKRLAVRFATIVSLGALAASPLVAFGKARWSRFPEDTEPRKELAAAATRFWREATGKPLVYVAGSFRYDNAVAFYSDERPHAFANFDSFGARWVTDEKLKEFGLLSVCLKDDAVCTQATLRLANDRTAREEITLEHDAWGHQGRPLSFVVTAIAPAGGS